MALAAAAAAVASPSDTVIRRLAVSGGFSTAVPFRSVSVDTPAVFAAASSVCRDCPTAAYLDSSSVTTWSFIVASVGRTDSTEVAV